MSDQRHRLLVLTAAALGLGVAGSLQAQSLYQQKVEIPTTFEYDSNPALVNPSAGGVSRWRISPNYTLLRRDGADELNLRLGATLERSSNTTLSQNRNDYDANVQWQHQSERGVYTLSAGVTRASLRDALLLETGQLVADGTRISKTLSASFTRELDELHTLSGGMSADWNSYSNSVGTPNSRQVGANLEISRALTPGTGAFASGNVSSFVPDSPFLSSSVMRGLMVGYRSNVQEAPWSWQISGGAASFTGPFSDTSAQFAAQATYQGQRWNATFGFSRQPVADSLLGTFSRNQQLRAGAEYLITEYTRVGIDASRNRTSSVYASATRTLGLNISTELTPVWRVAFSVRRLQLERSDLSSGAKASSTLAGVVLTYSHADF